MIGSLYAVTENFFGNKAPVLSRAPATMEPTPWGISMGGAVVVSDEVLVTSSQEEEEEGGEDEDQEDS